MRPLIALTCVSMALMGSMYAPQSRACSCVNFVMAFPPGPLALDSGIVALAPGDLEVARIFSLRDASGAEVPHTVKAFPPRTTCGNSVSILVPDAPLVNGATYTLSSPQWEPPAPLSLTASASAVLPGLPEVSLTYTRVQHNPRGAGYSCDPSGPDYAFSAFVRLHVANEPGLVVAELRSDDPSATGPHTVAAPIVLAAPGDDAPAVVDGELLRLPMPDPSACLTLDLYTVRGELAQSIKTCQPDRCATIENWFPDDGAPGLDFYIDADPEGVLVDCESHIAAARARNASGGDVGIDAGADSGGDSTDRRGAAASADSANSGGCTTSGPAPTTWLALVAALGWLSSLRRRRTARFVRV